MKFTRCSVKQRVFFCADGEKPPSGREVPRYEAVGARRAYQIRNTFCRRTNTGFPEIPLERGNDYLFLYLKEKGRKRSKPTFRWIVAPINCVARIFSVPEGTLPQMAFSPAPEAKRLEALGSRTGGFDLMGAVRIHLHHANHGTQTVWVCVPRFVGITIKWMQGCADGISPPPLGDLFPPCAGV